MRQVIVSGDSEPTTAQRLWSAIRGGRSEAVLEFVAGILVLAVVMRDQLGKALLRTFVLPAGGPEQIHQVIGDFYQAQFERINHSVIAKWVYLVLFSIGIGLFFYTLVWEIVNLWIKGRNAKIVHSYVNKGPAQPFWNRRTLKTGVILTWIVILALSIRYFVPLWGALVGLFLGEGRWWALPLAIGGCWLDIHLVVVLRRLATLAGKRG